MGITQTATCDVCGASEPMTYGVQTPPGWRWYGHSLSPQLGCGKCSEPKEWTRTIIVGTNWDDVREWVRVNCQESNHGWFTLTLREVKP